MMIRLRMVLSIGVLALGFAVQTAEVGAADYEEGSVIVKYREGAMRTLSDMNTLYDDVGVRSVHYFTGRFSDFETLRLEAGVKVTDAIETLSKHPIVEFAQPNFILRLPKQVRMTGDSAPFKGIPCIPGFDIPGCDPNEKMPCIFPGFPPGCDDTGGPGTPPPAQRPPVGEMPGEVNPPQVDPDLAQAWGLQKIQSPDAWKVERGNKKIIVAVIDTGVDYNHKDIAFNMWRNPNPTQNDIVGFDYVHNDGLPFDDQGHGSHTAGTVGAVGGDGFGVSGVAQRVSIMALKFLSSSGEGTTEGAIQAIDYAVKHGAKILSNSWGGKDDGSNQALYEAIERSRQADVLFVAASGNESNNNDGPTKMIPAAFDNDNIVAVAATDTNDNMAFFSNYGAKTTDLAAPGVNVHSLAPGNNGYAKHSGTSMACPHVSGAAALIWAKHPSWTYKQVKGALMCSVDKIEKLKGKMVTGGRLNALKALDASPNCTF